jgi:1-acyl-sn-glycerol-3-phosphate acyltransferase
MTSGHESRPTPLWRNVGFQVLWFSTAASGFGDRMIELAAVPMLGVLSSDAQAAPIFAKVYFFFFLPWIVVTPIGGWLADTLPRKWVLLACDEGRALILFAAFVMVPAGLVTRNIHIAPDQYWKVCAVLLAVGALASIFSPTRNAVIPQLLPFHQLNPANAIILGIGVIASLIGYLGNNILDHVSVRMGIAVAMLAYGASGLLFILMKPRPHTGLDTEHRTSEWRRLVIATNYIRHHRPVRDLILLSALVWSLAMVVAPAVGSLCRQNYRIPNEHFMAAFSTMSMCMGVGMLAAGLFVAFLNARRESSIVMLLALLVTSLCLVLLATNRSYHLGWLLAATVGFCGGTALIIMASLTQSITANYILGRVTGMREVLSNFVSVGVNLAVWQLGVLRYLNPKVPEPDPLLILLLYPLAVLIALVALRGLWLRAAHGPQPSVTANIFWRLCRLYTTTWHRLRWIGAHHIPRTGPILFASNHTTGLDPLLIQTPNTRMITWVMLTQYQSPILGLLWRTIHPIALHPGSGDLAEIRQIVRRLEAGEAVGLFPEGGLQRETRQLQPFARGIAMIARRSGAAIVPIWIDGTPRKHKMIWHFLCPSRSTVIFGRPYHPDPELPDQQVADDLRRRMLDLSKQVA